jgi:ABC-type Na+ efflux pump permease subunit
LLLFGLVAWSFEPLLVTLFRYAAGTTYPGTPLSSLIHKYVTSAGTAVACFLMLAAAVRGAAAVRIEKDKDTLDALLTSPLSTREILYGKWVGCLWGLRWLGVWLGAIYLVGVVTGGLSPLAVPLLAGALLVYCGVTALLGIWCSCGSPSASGDAVAAVTSTVLLWGAHWPLAIALINLYRLAFGEPGIGDSVVNCMLGMTPPAVLGNILPFAPGDLPGSRDAGSPRMLGYALAGLLYWAALGRLIWFVARKTFEEAHNRSDLHVPDGRRRSAGRPAGGVP